jgi:NADH dehydrogenase
MPSPGSDSADPHPGLTRMIDVDKDARGALVVQPDCSLAADRHVFAVGDIARFTPAGHEAPLPGIAPVALQQGRLVAQNIKRDLAGQERRAFRYRDKGMLATVGRSRAVGQMGKVRLTGMVAWLLWIFVHVWFLIGFRNRVLVLFDWFWAWFTFNPGNRVLTGVLAKSSLRPNKVESSRTEAKKVRPRRGKGSSSPSASSFPNTLQMAPDDAPPA